MLVVAPHRVGGASGVSAGDVARGEQATQERVRSIPRAPVVDEQSADIVDDEAAKEAAVVEEHPTDVVRGDRAVAAQLAGILTEA